MTVHGSAMDRPAVPLAAPSLVAYALVTEALGIGVVSGPGMSIRHGLAR